MQTFSENNGNKLTIKLLRVLNIQTCSNTSLKPCVSFE
jgi:hypothetical protein